MINRVLFAENGLRTDLIIADSKRKPNIFERVLFAEDGWWTVLFNNSEKAIMPKSQLCKINFSDKVTNKIRKKEKLDATNDGRTDKMILVKQPQNNNEENKSKLVVNTMTVHNLEEENYVTNFDNAQNIIAPETSELETNLTGIKEVAVPVSIVENAPPESPITPPASPKSADKVAVISVKGPCLSSILSQPAASRRSPERMRPKTADTIEDGSPSDNKSIGSTRKKQQGVFGRHSSMKRKTVAVAVGSGSDTLSNDPCTTSIKMKENSNFRTWNVAGPLLSQISPPSNSLKV